MGAQDYLQSGRRETAADTLQVALHNVRDPLGGRRVAELFDLEEHGAVGTVGARAPGNVAGTGPGRRAADTDRRGESSSENGQLVADRGGAAARGGESEVQVVAAEGAARPCDRLEIGRRAGVHV